MKFDLICDNSVKDLGIIDDAGHFDMDKFHSHIESCETCLDLMESFANFLAIKKEYQDGRKKRSTKISPKGN